MILLNISYSAKENDYNKIIYHRCNYNVSRVEQIKTNLWVINDTWKIKWQMALVVKVKKNQRGNTRQIRKKLPTYN